MSAVTPCGQCAHFNARQDVSPIIGECRRYPPVPLQEPRPTAPSPRNPNGGVSLVTVAYYPPVINTEWCGEWAPRPIAANDQGAN